MTAETLDFLKLPFYACLVIGALHCYMGLHIIRRGVIFVDLALAQMAALGATVALMFEHSVLGEDPSRALELVFNYGMALSFAFMGAALFSIGRFRDNRVPHEAVIGIVYVVSAAVALLLLSKSPHGAEETEGMLLGHLLFVTPSEVIWTAVIYAGLAVPHLIWGRKFLLISSNLREAERQGLPIRLLDFFFYAIFGVMVTQSVRIGGVLVVFSFLIIPAVCAAIFFRSFWWSLLFGWIVAVIASVLGFGMSVHYDWPTGASLVAAFGLLLIGCSVIYKLIRKKLPATGEPA